MARIAALEARVHQEVSVPPAATVQERAARVPGPLSARWLPVAGALATTAATVLVTASVATSSDSLMPSVAGFRMGLFAMPGSGDEFLASAMGTMLYAVGLFAFERFVQRQRTLPRHGDAEHLTGSS
jgi:hypothetical protein